MKRLCAITLGILVAIPVFGQQTFDKNVRMDEAFRLRDRETIIISNELAVTGGDIQAGETNQSTVIGLQGFPIVAPGGAGDAGKMYVWDGAAWDFMGMGAATSEWGLISGNISNQTDLFTALTNRYTKPEVDSLLVGKVDVTGGVATNLALNGSTEDVEATSGTMVVNWNVLTNQIALGTSGFLTTNDSPTMAPGTTWAFSIATVTNVADADDEIVNWQSLTNFVAQSSPVPSWDDVMEVGNLTDKNIRVMPETGNFYLIEVATTDGSDTNILQLSGAEGSGASLGRSAHLQLWGMDTANPSLFKAIGTTIEMWAGAGSFGSLQMDFGTSGITAYTNFTLDGSGNGPVSTFFTLEGTGSTVSVMAWNDTLNGSGNEGIIRYLFANSNMYLQTPGAGVLWLYDEMATGLQDDEIVNWSALTNEIAQGTSEFLTTNSTPTMLAGAEWIFSFANVTNLATTGNEIVNWIALTNQIASSVPTLAEVMTEGNVANTNLNMAGFALYGQRELPMFITNGTQLTLADSGKLLIYTGVTQQAFVNLPTNISLATRGTEFVFVNLTTNLLIIDAFDTDYIDDSDLGGQVYSGFNTNNVWPFSSATLKQADSNWWHMLSARGDWTTTGTNASPIPPEVRAIGGTFTMVAEVATQTVSYATTYNVDMFPFVMPSSDFTFQAIPEILIDTLTRSNFQFRVRGASELVTNDWRVIWGANPAE